MESLSKYFPDIPLRKRSYLYEYTTFWGAPGACEVTIFDAVDEVFVILTESKSQLGPGVSSNFEAIATGLKTVDPLLIDCPPEKIHWIEYRGPGSYDARLSPSFLLVIMSFNPLLKRFVRASWGHIFNLAELIVRGCAPHRGELCPH